MKSIIRFPGAICLSLAFLMNSCILLFLPLSNNKTVDPKPKSTEISSFDISILERPFSIELDSGEIIPIRFKELSMAEFENNDYVIYYKNGESERFPVSDIKAVRFDIIDKKSKRIGVAKTSGATIFTILVIIGITALVLAITGFISYIGSLI